MLGLWGGLDVVRLLGGVVLEEWLLWCVSDGGWGCCGELVETYSWASVLASEG